MGTIIGWPSVAQVGDSTVIAARDPDNSLVSYWQPTGSQQWNPEQVAGPGRVDSRRLRFIEEPRETAVSEIDRMRESGAG